MDSVGGGVVAEIFRDPYSVGGGGSSRNFPGSVFSGGGGSSRNFPGSIFCGFTELFQLTAITDPKFVFFSR